MLLLRSRTSFGHHNILLKPTFALMQKGNLIAIKYTRLTVCRQNLLDKFVKESRESLTHRG